MNPMYQQTEDIKNQTEILELNNSKSRTKRPVDGIENSREDRRKISELENRTREISQSENQRENRCDKKNECHLNNSWDYNKMSNSGVIEVLGRQEKEDGTEKNLNR